MKNLDGYISMADAPDDRPFATSGEGPAGGSARGVTATNFKWRDPATIPPRQFLYGRHTIRGFVSVTAAFGGVGKTTLKLVEAAALATGRDLLGDGFSGSTPVWYIGLEDPLEEYERRLAAIALRHGIPGAELEKSFFLDSGRDQNFVIAIEERSGVKIVEPIVASIIENVRRHGIGLIVVDPFVACHAVGENDNTRLEKVTRAWAHIAQEAGCGVELIHHVRKGNGSAEPSADDVRGASAVVNAARSVRILTPMSKEEGEAANIEDRRRYFRITFGKANLFLPPEVADWREMKSVSLGNGGGGPDDHIGVAVRWTWPNALDGLHVSDLVKVQDKIAGGEWAENSQAANWAGLAVAEALDLNVSDMAAKSRIKSLLKTWIANDALKVQRSHSARNGRERPMIVVGARS